MKERIVIDNCGWHFFSGGIRVLNYLAALLHSAGARVATTSQCYFNPLLPVADKCGPDDVILYPEIVEGNPRQAKRVARYILYFQKYYCPKEECPILYNPAFRESSLALCEATVPEDRVVRLSYIEWPWLCYPEEKTVEHLLYPGKRNCPHAPAEVNPLVNLDAWAHPLPHFNRQVTLAFLRRTRNFYTMDHYTSMEPEALLCGCNVFQVHGPTDLRPMQYDPEPHIMRPERDLALARKFIRIIEEFFNL